MSRKITATDRELARILRDALSRTTDGAAHEGMIGAFAAELARQGSLWRLDGIVAALQQEEEQPLRASVAHDVAVAGAAVSIDPELIAGGRLERADVRVDASVQGRIRKLRHALRAG